MTIIAIEHLESKLWRWLYLEYINSARHITHELIICNLPREYHRYFTSVNVTSKSVLDIYDVNRIIILDPQANETLSPECISDDDVIVVGGILGADPPLDRTKRMITDKVPGARSYNIGSRQLTIDGSVFVASKVAGGSEIDEIDFIDDIEIRTDWSTMITLPYRYPIRDGKPIISNEIVDLVKRYGLPDPNDLETFKIWGELDE